MITFSISHFHPGLQVLSYLPVIFISILTLQIYSTIHFFKFISTNLKQDAALHHAERFSVQHTTVTLKSPLQ